MIRRRFFTAASMISLALLLAAIVFWLRSSSMGDQLIWHRGTGYFEATSVNGELLIGFGTLVDAEYPPLLGLRGSFWPFHREIDYIRADLQHDTTLGFHYERWQERTQHLFADARIIVLPYWLLLACFSVLPLVRLVSLLRRKRPRKENQCRACGYDLTGNTSGVCPECGTPVRRGRGVPA